MIRKLASATFAFAVSFGARAAEIQMGLLSPEIAPFCLHTGTVHDSALSPFKPESVVTLKKVQISVSLAPIAVNNGDVDMVECAGPAGLIQAWRQGARNAAIVFVGSAKPPYQLIGGKTIKTPQDLKGKTVGSPGAQSTAIESSMTILKHAAGMLAGKDYDVVSAGTGAARVAALSTGKIDAIPSYPPLSYTLADQGFNIVAKQSDYVPAYVLGTMVVNKTWASKNRDTVVSLLKSFVQTGLWMRDPANKDAVIEALGKAVTEGPGPMGPAHARLFYKDVIESGQVAFDGYAPAAAFEANMDIMSDLWGMKRDDFPPLKEIVDYSYLNAAYRALGMPEISEFK